MRIRKDYKIGLKNRFINCFMYSGKKRSSELLFLKSAKHHQKSNANSLKRILHEVTVNFATSFNVNITKRKRGKKRKLIETVYFLSSNRLREMRFFKSYQNVIKASRKLDPLFKVLSTQLFNKHSLKDSRESVIEKIRTNRRYTSRFRW